MIFLACKKLRQITSFSNLLKSGLGSLPVVRFDESTEIFSALDGTISNRFEVDIKDIVSYAFSLVRTGSMIMAEPRTTNVVKLGE
jgi:hypothetical protein